MTHETLAVAGLLIVIYIGYKSRKIQSGIEAAQSMVGPVTESDIPHVQEEIDTNYMDPSTVYRLIKGGNIHHDIPGLFGVMQRNHRGMNDNEMATYGPNYSNSFT